MYVLYLLVLNVLHYLERLLVLGHLPVASHNNVGAPFLFLFLHHSCQVGEKLDRPTSIITMVRLMILGPGLNPVPTPRQVTGRTHAALPDDAPTDE